jgi:hypothetical protein
MFAIAKMRANFKPVWVRKLMGKPVFLTIADCESEARRIQLTERNYEPGLSPPAAESKVFRTHSDVEPPERFTAAEIAVFSSGESLACTRIPRNLAFGTFGLPIFGFIKYFVYDVNKR